MVIPTLGSQEGAGLVVVATGMDLPFLTNDCC
jgi:hypothetical protein